MSRGPRSQLTPASLPHTQGRASQGAPQVSRAPNLPLTGGVIACRDSGRQMGLGPGYFVSCRIDVLLVDSPFKHPFAFTSRNADNICSVNYTHLHAQTVPYSVPQMRTRMCGRSSLTAVRQALRISREERPERSRSPRSNSPSSARSLPTCRQEIHYASTADARKANWR